MATQSSYEETAFLEKWMTFAWHMYYSLWPAQPSFTLVEETALTQRNVFSAVQWQCIRLIEYLTHCQGDVAQDKTTDSSRTSIPFQKSACIQIQCFCYTFKQCFIVLGLKDAQSSIYDTFQGRAAYIKGCDSQNMVRCLRRIWCIQRNNVQIWRTSSTCLHFHEKGIACERKFIFDIEADMCHFNGMLCRLKEVHMLKGTFISNRCKTPFKGIIWSVWTCGLKGLVRHCQH